jgi:hypothetical protein
MDAELDRDPNGAPRSAQLRLIDPAPPAWRLDEHTREVGRLGVAAARAALRTARSHQVDQVDQEHDHHERSAA